jgi:D-alanyl-lipoteichoic acid acyltransferase DltB (MBOAT superfamily)
MVFNSFHFAWFFAAVLGVYWLLPRRGQNLFLLGAGYYFYSCWDPRFLLLLIASTLADYALGLWVDRLTQPGLRKLGVAFSMTLNLGFLGFFKYFNFFAENLGLLLSRMGLHAPLWTLQVALPVGISFYTFQSMSYVIDIYRREVKPTRDLVEFATFVSFFPHLVAGPIMRPTTLLPQIEQTRRFSWPMACEGTYLIFWGLVKKVVVADNLARTVDAVFTASGPLEAGTVWLGMFAFAFQVYGDFSGYTDIARGVAKWLGFELALNFNLPYFSCNPSEFWQRWHISLSTWLRDYVFIPLGGSRGGLAKTCRNLMLTMLLGGLWHGAAWTYVLWGAYAGALLVIHRMLRPVLAAIAPHSGVAAGMWKLACMIGFFHLHGLGLILFRSRSLEQFSAMMSGLFRTPAWPDRVMLGPVLALVIPLVAMEWIQYRANDHTVIFRAPWPVRSLFYTGALYALILLGEFGGQQFIYFQF